MRFFTLIIVLFTLPVQAEIFCSTAADGGMHCSDRPAPDKEKVDLGKPSVYTVPRGRASAGSGAAADTGNATNAQDGSYQSVRIVSPQPDQVFTSASSSVSVRLSVIPGLQQGHKVLYLVDGQKVGGAVASTSNVLTDIKRGTHRISAHIVDQSGQVVALSKPVIFHMLQPSVARPDSDTADDNDGDDGPDNVGDANPAPAAPGVNRAPAVPRRTVPTQ